MLVEDLRHVDVAVGRAGLPVIGTVGAKQGRLPPMEAGIQDKPVETIVLSLAAPNGQKAFFEIFAPPQQIVAAVIRQMQAAVVKVNTALLPLILGVSSNVRSEITSKPRFHKDRNALGQNQRFIHLQQRGTYTLPV